MSIHISARPGEIAKIVLMPGDPLRAKYIAETRLEKIRLVSEIRNVVFYTGSYRGIPLTVGGSGMGCPSIGIYSFELYNDYEVECILRIGTCGAYTNDIHLFDLINVERAYSESAYAKAAFDMPADHYYHQGPPYDIINGVADQQNITLLKGAVHSADAFYRTGRNLPVIAMENKCLAAEMESFALFANAQQFSKMAATLLTVSDIIPGKKQLSAEEREKSLDAMTSLALDATPEIHEKLEAPGSGS